MMGISRFFKKVKHGQEELPSKGDLEIDGEGDKIDNSVENKKSGFASKA